MAVAANVVEATVLAVGYRVVVPGKVAKALDHGRPTPERSKMSVKVGAGGWGPQVIKIDEMDT